MHKTETSHENLSIYFNPDLLYLRLFHQCLMTGPVCIILLFQLIVYFLYVSF